MRISTAAIPPKAHRQRPARPALKALVNHALGGDVTAGYVTMTTERLRGPARRVADRMKKLCGITSSRHDPRPQKLAP
jgi:hypothetical protein